MGTRRSALLLASIALALALGTATYVPGTSLPARAAVPGENGLLVLDGGLIVAPDGSGIRRDSWNAGSPSAGKPGSSPAYSPDGNRIAYAAGDPEEIFVVAQDGYAKKQLTRNVADDLSPTWSPDGSELIFVSARDGNAELYKMDASGGGVVRLTTSEGEESAPVWSPRGDRVAFVRGGEIYTMRPSPANETTNPPEPLAQGDDPDWSPDGGRLVYAHFDSGGDEYDCKTWIRTIDAGGGGMSDVRSLASSCEKGYYLGSPLWSPDGNTLVYGIYHVFDGPRVMATNLSGTEMSLVYRGPTNNGGYRDPSDWQARTGATLPGTYLTGFPSEAWNGRRASLEFASTEDGAAFRCSLDGAAFRDCTSPKSYTGLSHGGHVFRVRSTNDAGRRDPTPAKYAWNVDRRKPSITRPRPGPGGSTKDRTPRISAVVRDPDAGIEEVSLFKDGKRANAAYGYITKKLVYQHEPGKEFAFGEHSVKVVARDQAGNVAVKSWNFAVVR